MCVSVCETSTVLSLSVGIYRPQVSSFSGHVISKAATFSSFRGLLMDSHNLKKYTFFCFGLYYYSQYFSFFFIIYNIFFLVYSTFVPLFSDLLTSQEEKTD